MFVLVSQVKNLIFDLGGVILDLSVESTLQSFAKVSGLPAADVKERFAFSELFNDYEKGLVSDYMFRDGVRQVFKVDITNDQLDACWNAMLLGIPRVKLDLLNSLKETYNVFLLSNTNNIHLRYINTKLVDPKNEHASLDVYFHRAYYSHRMLKRKPEPEIFEQVLEENRLIPEESLFLDDNASNVAAAERLGIRTLHVTNPQLVLDYFHA